MLTLKIEQKTNKKRALKDTKANEDELRQAREWRYRQQKLLGSPVTRHMRTVEATKTVFTGRVGPQLMTSSPFKLTALMKRKNNVDNERSFSDVESLGSASA